MRRAWLAALLAGGATVFAFAPFGLFPLAFLGLGVLLLAAGRLLALLLLQPLLRLAVRLNRGLPGEPGLKGDVFQARLHPRVLVADAVNLGEVLGRK